MITRRTATGALLVGGAFSLSAQSIPPAPGKTRGSVMAPMKLELYSDYQCPACKQLHDQTVKPLIDEYVNKGKVFLIYREFPLPMHPYAKDAASLAVAAARLGKYEQVGDAIFSKQEAWTKSGKPEEALATLPAADLAKIRAAAKSPEVAAEITRETEAGRKANIQQTPTMIFSYKGKTYPVGGFVTWNILKRFVDDMLTR